MSTQLACTSQTDLTKSTHGVNGGVVYETLVLVVYLCMTHYLQMWAAKTCLNMEDNSFRKK